MLTSLDVLTHSYEGNSEYIIYPCYAETRRRGAHRVEVMSRALQPQSGIFVHSASYCCHWALLGTYVLESPSCCTIS